MNDKYMNFMKFNFIILLTIIFSLYIFPNNNKIMKLRKNNSSIIVDGLIDPDWNYVDSVSDFIQFQPYNGKEPTRKTIAKVFTTDDALYCMMICYDDKTNIEQNAGTLDNFTGDIVSIMLDTFGDKRTAYKFAVSASGVRSDCRLLDDARNRDYSWDGVWFAASNVYDWGFIVEMEIPYRSIQYDEKLSSWGLDFDRWRPAESEDIYWCSYEENEGQRISKFGKLLFEDFYPIVKGLNLEIYPVAITKATYLYDKNYKIDPNAGIDIFYNPSTKLTFQLTGNPDFAQIEADPFQFNISRYETYYTERRPFFTEGNEIFAPSGRERNSGFYKPMDLFYSRRIGKKLPNGAEVPLLVGTKAFGRINDWEYGGFVAVTGENTFQMDSVIHTEEQAFFGFGRVKRQIFENSSIGLLVVNKHTKSYDNGLIDIDGAFRGSDWQLAYQIAQSFYNKQGGFAVSAGMIIKTEKWFTGISTKGITQNFTADQIGFVPWKGTAEVVGVSGPRWYFGSGLIRQILLYGGGFWSYEDADAASDFAGALGFNMQFRSNWGYEVNLNFGRSKDNGVKYNLYSVSITSNFNMSPKWNGNIWSELSKIYNFKRNYLAFYSSFGSNFNWRTLNILSLGATFNIFIEGNPNNKIQDITFNSRPSISFTPVNDLNLRVYFDNVFVSSTNRLQQLIVGFLFSYNFLPKSWIYFAINEVQDRSDEFDFLGNLLPNRMHTTSRAGVLKIKYLYYI